MYIQHCVTAGTLKALELMGTHEAGGYVHIPDSTLWRQSTMLTRLHFSHCTLESLEELPMLPMLKNLAFYK